MDAKVFRMAILMIISAFILVLVIVYATNVDKLSALFGGGKDKSGPQSTEEISVDEQVSGKFSPTQIGDNLSGFELDADFFDPTERVPAVVVRRKNTESGDKVDAAAAENLSSEQEPTGTGMAIVGDLINPNPEAGYYSTGNFNPYSADTSLSDSYDGAMGAAGGVSAYDNSLSTGANSLSGASLNPGSYTPGTSTAGSTGISAGSSNTPVSPSGTSVGSSGTPQGFQGTPAGSTGISVSLSPDSSASVSSGTISSSTGYLQSTYDDYIPASQTITGTPVGIP
ncbi:MAG: hypothetical protein K6E91_10755 [Butyrivibrio sp.]|nr:hypothetical protein [Butyrivibrio sp.]